MKSKYARYRNLIRRPLKEVLKKLHLNIEEFEDLLHTWLAQDLINERNPHLTEIEHIKRREINRKNLEKNEEDYLSYQYMRQEGYSVEDISATLERDVDKIIRYDRRWYHELLDQAEDNVSLEEIHAATQIPFSLLIELEQAELQRQEEVLLAQEKQIRSNIDYAQKYLPIIEANRDNLIIYDLEGLQLPDEILEAAAITVEGEVLINTLVRPSHHIGYHISRLTGITDEMARKGEKLKKVMRELKSISDGKILLSWGIKYDQRLINAGENSTGVHLNNCVFVDVQRIFSGVHENCKLTALYKAANKEDQSHRALDDCFMLLDVLEDLLKEFHQKEETNE